MVGFLLLYLTGVALYQDETSLRNEIVRLSTELLPLQERVQQKESCILKLDEIIADLQRQVEGVKAPKSDKMVKKNEEELFNLENKIQGLLSDIDKLGSESKQLEIVSARQLKQLNEAQLALDLVERSIIQAQAQSDENDCDIDKVHTQWLPYWAKENLPHWQGTWISTLKEASKRAVLLAMCGCKKLQETRFLRHWDVLEAQIWTYKQRAQKIVEEEVHAAWEFYKSFLTAIFKTSGLPLHQLNSILQHFLSKLNLYFIEVLKYGINYHLQLQRKIRNLMKRNNYLASKESREIVWFLASAVLILPLYGALLISSFLGTRRRSLVTRTTPYHRRRQAVHLSHAQRRSLMVT